MSKKRKNRKKNKNLKNKPRKEREMTFKDKESNILGVKLREFGECGWCKEESDAILQIPFSTWAEWLFITSRMDKNEWTAVFDVVGDVLVDYRIPKQEVASGSCELEEDLGGNGIVHSHHSMGAFHSGQDDKHARNLYQWSIVLSHTDYVITHRAQLPCGGWGHKKCKIELLGAPEIPFSNFQEKHYGVLSYSTGAHEIGKPYTPYYVKNCAWCGVELEHLYWIPNTEASDDSPLCDQCASCCEMGEAEQIKEDFHHDCLS